MDDPVAVDETLVATLRRADAWRAMEHGGCQFSITEEIAPFKAADRIEQLNRALAEARDRQASLFTAIKHGDDAHREWLSEAITAHFAGQPVPQPRGMGTKEAAAAEARSKALEEVARWYKDTGWRLDEDAVPDAIRSLIQNKVGR